MTTGDPFSEYVTKLVGSIVVHPLTVSRILIQLGWEPVPPVLGRTLFRRERLYYPNMLRHVGWVRDELGGSVALFTTGLTAKLLSQLAKELVLRGVETASGSFGGGDSKDRSLVSLDKVARDKNWEVSSESVSQLTQRCCYSSVGRSIAVVASYPLHSIMVRQIAAAVCHDSAYRGGIITVAREVWDAEGLAGFFQGVTVAVVGDLLALWGTSFIAYALNKYVLADRVAPDMKQASPMVAAFLVSSWTYRYGVVSTNLCLRGSSGLTLSVPYTNSRECWSALKLAGGLNRGDGMFWRVAPASAVARRR